MPETLTMTWDGLKKQDHKHAGRRGHMPRCGGKRRPVVYPHQGFFLGVGRGCPGCVLRVTVRVGVIYEIIGPVPDHPLDLVRPWMISPKKAEKTETTPQKNQIYALTLYH